MCIRDSGSTDLVAGLRAAADQLRATKAQLRHIILFTDGFTADGALTTARDLAASLYAEGITVSVLATGETAAGPELKEVADAGHGRFYPGLDLQEIPRILAEEAVLASRSLIVEGEEVPRVVGSLAPVRDLRAAPALLGHVATTARPQAEVGLRVGVEDDPLLASWQAGLGRVTAWTSDAGTRWATPWARWDGAVPFWTALVKDSFGTGGAGLEAAASVSGERLRISAEAPAGPETRAVAVAPGGSPAGQTLEVPLERIEKGFAGEAAATAAGTYAVGVEVRGAGPTSTASALATQSYAPEYRPGGPDAALLAQLAAVTGGRVDVAADRVFDGAGLKAGKVRHPLAGLLLLLAALLWPCEIAVRRLSRRRTLAAPARVTRPTAGAGSAPAAPAPPPPEPPAEPEEVEPDTTLTTLLRATRKKRDDQDAS